MIDRTDGRRALSQPHGWARAFTHDTKQRTARTVDRACFALEHLHSHKLFQRKLA